MSLPGPMDGEEVALRVERSRPVGFPDASVGSILVVGSGTWIDATGEKRGEHRLVELLNAPRLSAALRSLDTFLGVPAEPGDPTYFGSAEGHGIKRPDVIDGRGPDLTDLLRPSFGKA
ncbi:hypothetical protein [Streptomyces griseiscabiei]|uniref:Uncharacterized protein n=1 Tax=Streptomyces griseiscabiei TaxID=2993540 RepID=A0ABU4KZN0_9ACTN|nr:hypothetical protein [Streptomyces griseiscabiei]MDX2908665.1 hypothetical protein [Streptomyces griseiscabiei]